MKPTFSLSDASPLGVSRRERAARHSGAASLSFRAALGFGLAFGCGGEGGSGSRPSLLDTSDREAEVVDMSCDEEGASVVSGDLPSLAEAYRDHFRIGVALGGRALSGRDPGAAEVAAGQYNRATAENAFKWQSLQNEPGEWSFEQMDGFLAFTEQNEMEVHGHTIVWHQQVPGWVFQAEGGMTREILLERLETHVSMLAERTAGRVAYWDVVNEAFTDSGSLRSTPWLNIIGDDYLEQAFRIADRHFPDAKLVYNDFGMTQPGKRDGVARMVRDFKARGVRIDAVGMQGHYRLTTPGVELIEASINAFAAEGVEVLVTELDVDVLPAAQDNQGADLDVNGQLSSAANPYVDCLPTVVDVQAAERWASIFEVFRDHSDVVSSVTLWGVSDGHSWLNNWPVNGRTNYALLFDRQLRPKRALQRVIEVATDSE